MDVTHPLLCLLGFCSVTAPSNEDWIQGLKGPGKEIGGGTGGGFYMSCAS